MHTYYSNEHQSITYAGYLIFVAEVASTCNESLLMHYMLEHCEDENERKYLMTHFLDGFRTTLFRQAQFAEFELPIPEKVQMDKIYCDNVSFVFDVKCLFMTVVSVFKHDGVVEGGTGAIADEE